MLYPITQNIQLSNPLCTYVDKEERWNTWTHGVAAVIALLSGIHLCVTMWHSGTAGMWGTMLGTMMMTLLFVVSATFHHCRQSKRKWRWRIFDHCAIYLSMAGTITPVMLAMNTAVSLIFLVWIMAIGGTFHKLLSPQRFSLGAMAYYLVFGGFLLIVYLFSIQPMLPASTANLVMAGWVSYGIGFIFFTLKQIPFSHTIWHLMVMVGAGLHHLSMYGTILG